MEFSELIICVLLSRNNRVDSKLGCEKYDEETSHLLNWNDNQKIAIVIFDKKNR